MYLLIEFHEYFPSYNIEKLFLLIILLVETLFELSRIKKFGYLCRLIVIHSKVKVQGAIKSKTTTNISMTFIVVCDRI